MAYEWIDEAAGSLPWVTVNYKPEWEQQIYRVAGKMFGNRGGYKDRRPIVTIKLEPSHGDFLRNQHPGVVIPGYYSNKTHWNSIFIEEVSKEQLLELLKEAYGWVYASLPAKTRRELEAQK